MDFFAHQDLARRRSRLLVLYYLLAVVSLIILTYLAVIGLFYLPEVDKVARQNFSYRPHLFDLKIFSIVSVAVLSVIAIGTLVKVIFLREGGAAIARTLGGQRVNPDLAAPYERRLLNIVEEIAIASGTPIPQVFLLDHEEGINAFAAGYNLNDTAIGVTFGAMTKLSRDELQGVIAHEFSHILNSDMRLNIRMVGVLNGILGIYIIGRTLIRACLQGGGRRYSSNSRRGGLPYPILIFAVALVIIGSLGAFFARIIQSAVSRQREFLADASAVQFTRNPSGISNALKKIGGFSSGSRITDGHAPELSHMFFSEGVGGFLSFIFSTHPPLTTRIKRIEPGFIGQYETIPEDYHADISTEIDRHSAVAAFNEPAPFKISVEDTVQSVGMFSSEHIDRAKKIIASLPRDFVEIVHDRDGAQAVIACLLLSSDRSQREMQIGLINQIVSNEIFNIVLGIERFFVSFPVQHRLPLVEIAISTLQQMSAEEYGIFNRLISELVQSDGTLNHFEYVLITLIRHGIEARLFKSSREWRQVGRIDPLLSDIGVVLSVLANSGERNIKLAEQHFDAGLEYLAAKYGAKYLPPEKSTLQLLNAALDRLSVASPEIKQKVVAACVRTASHDNMITVTEAELLRAVSMAIGCPLPLF